MVERIELWEIFRIGKWVIFFPAKEEIGCWEKWERNEKNGRKREKEGDPPEKLQRKGSPQEEEEGDKLEMGELWNWRIEVERDFGGRRAVKEMSRFSLTFGLTL